MPGPRDSGQIDLAEVFRRVQTELLGQLNVGQMFSHPVTAGAASEQQWLTLFERYLPQRYRSAPAFVIDSKGGCSQQIDLVVFDNLYSPLLFPHDAGLHVPVESVYAVFEIKTIVGAQQIGQAVEKAASVRGLSATSVSIIGGGRKLAAIRPQRILAGILAPRSSWTSEGFGQYLRRSILQSPACDRLDLGCCLELGPFNRNRVIQVSSREDSLQFFILHLLTRLRAMGTAPAADFMKYARYEK